jgi:hypothetical protein
MLAHAALALSVVVRLYDAHGVPVDTRAGALVTVNRILGDAGIHVTWAECPCDGRVASSELMIRIAVAPSSGDPASLGFSYVDVEQRMGTLATVFADRVHALATFADVNEGELLGRAMAHEIGHLLLGTPDHANVGLLRGRWTSRELAQNRPVDWQLSRGEGARLRQGLVRRLRIPAAPEMAIARREVDDMASSIGSPGASVAVDR